ncbi:RsmD family RNA methyltransferase [Puniceicoccus vermicola]|uniref:RsmD family RNA methyltransferase n=1 Tax=Puniceicoccus vermicola TaxID=388746 RepID=A0A7X1E7C7_9BACT|nr:RsmD family RNA methyltransferase [Puniceicoccus vermicola]MBC2603577.1 RsmD family RNA methyltransferase [Puniceicoccus vermicola]
MRITGGKAAGVRLQVPKKGPEVRPATDRMRESVFSSLGPDIGNTRILDLFAGTGAYGLEALSRGAREVIWVESARKTASLLELNRQEVEKSMGQRSSSRVLIRDIRKHGLRAGERFDYIFADPPYELADRLLSEIFLIAGQHLAESADSKFLLEVPGRLTVEESGWEETRRFGGDKSGPSLRVFVRTSE